MFFCLYEQVVGSHIYRELLLLICGLQQKRH